jgi:3-oxoacid CoA-transferase subunit A
MLERGIRADLAIIKAGRADERGQCGVPQDRAQLQPSDGDRGKVCVAEVEEIVPVGSIDPDRSTCPASIVEAPAQRRAYDKQIEFRTTRESGDCLMPWTRDEMAAAPPRS